MKPRSAITLSRGSRAGAFRTIFGYPGDGINGILAALDRAKNEIRFIQARHEEMAAFMACAHAKFTGEVGVCLATSGPGAIHLLNGLYDAKMDHQPVVAIVGQRRAPRSAATTSRKSICCRCSRTSRSEYVQTVDGARRRSRHLIDRAMRIALDRAHGDLRDRAQRCAGESRRDAAARAQHGPHRHRLHRRRASCRSERRSAARRRHAQRRRARGDARRRRRAAARPTK